MINKTIKHIYTEAALSILEMVRMIVLEVHYIQSEIMKDDTINILCVTKKNEDIRDYIEILVAEGFRLNNISKDVVIMTNNFKDYIINYYFVNENEREMLSLQQLVGVKG
ncbi:hypothetical protein [Nosocomiicoccus ampullae]|uniref:Uncharacterized protein n=1 Tax=Nosocomiicoccus ampullae TaxID=489910 RepID=A0A9Q2HG41_9STAP|nr:hypothetical protein [Nosocomiicoccus ampullae]MBB5176486.1 hypothetical protein [Nosocomiicoccus ampullae]QYA46527.1 hypothetical protein KPF49_06055 [Nosocomiicoccus ampullae]